MESIKRIKNKLWEEYCENNIRINGLNYKVKVLEANTTQRKSELLALFSGVPFCVFQIIANGLLISNIISFSFLIEPLIIGSSLLIGAISTFRNYKNNDYKNKLQRFSSAKNQKEIIEELTSYEMQKEKLLNSNKILFSILSELQKRQDLMEQGFVKQTNNDNLEDVNINKFLKMINSCMKKINTIITKSIMYKSFGKYLNKEYIAERIIMSLLTGCFLSLSFFLPGIITQNGNGLHFLLSLFGSSLVTSSILTKFDKDKKLVFEKINNELGEDALQETDVFELLGKKNTKELNLEELIEKVSQSKLQLEELILQKELESNITTQNNAQNIKNSDSYDTYLFDEIDNNEDTLNDTLQSERGPVLQKTRIPYKK